MRPGFGYGYNCAVVFDPPDANLPEGKGTFFWDGAAGTWFWVDPTNDVVFVGMIQRMLGPSSPNLEYGSRSAVYGALDGPGEVVREPRSSRPISAGPAPWRSWQLHPRGLRRRRQVQTARNEDWADGTPDLRLSSSLAGSAAPSQNITDGNLSFQREESDVFASHRRRGPQERGLCPGQRRRKRGSAQLKQDRSW